MGLTNIKRSFSDNIKNIRGWKTSRKIVIFSVDDYGNVRLDSKKAKDNLEKAGMKGTSRFDNYDTLETEQDLLALYDVLSSVKDKNGNNAVFTAFALPVNIDFEKMQQEGFQQYHYETLPVTFSKLPGYDKVWDLWKEGMEKHLLIPQSHGREHFNLKVFEELMHNRDTHFITALQNRSYTNIKFKKYPTISYTAAFDFDKFEENKRFDDIIKDGLNLFENVFGFRSVNFTPPGGREHPYTHKILQENGVRFIDTPFDKSEHQGNGVYKRKFNYMGKTNNLGQTFLIRNVVFEPAQNKNYNWTGQAMSQIETAFKWNKPAVISSHRVNYCGLIDEDNRKAGLASLQQLLKKIVVKWPDVEFMAANELGELIKSAK